MESLNTHASTGARPHVIGGRFIVSDLNHCATMPPTIPYTKYVSKLRSGKSLNIPKG